MDSKTFVRVALTVAALCCQILLPSSGKGADWTTFTSFKNARHFRSIDSKVYAVTSGGLLVLSDPSLPGEKLTNIDGLGTTDIFDIIKDASNQKWVAGNGRLVRFEGNNPRQFPFFDNNNDLFSPLSIADDGDFLWVGSEIGLILFAKLVDDGQIQDSYQLFGTLNSSPRVTDLFVDGDSIWLATSSGLALADKSDFNSLKDRNNWITFDVVSNPELLTDIVRQVVSFEGNIYVGTARGLFRLDRSVTPSLFVSLPVVGNFDVTDLHVDNDSLFIYHSGGMAVLKSGVVTAIDIGGLPSVPLAGLNDGQTRWLAEKSGGIYFSTGGVFSEYPFTGMPVNDVADINITPAGELSVLFTAGPAATIQADSSWQLHPIPVGDRGLRLISDSNGVLWAGVWGPGVWSIVDSQLTQYTDKAGSPTSQDGVGDNNLVSFGLYADETYLYTTSFLARNGNPLSIARLDNLDSPVGWISFGQPDGIIDNWIISLDVFGGFVSIGSGVAGVFTCFIGDDPFDKSDDFCRQFLEGFNSGNLISNTVRVVRYSPDGVLWVATNFGLSRFDRGIDRFVDVPIAANIVFGPDFTAIDFDSRGNAWVGARNGLGRFDATTGELTLFTIQNSDIVSDDIHSLTVDRRTNTLWVGTISGISRLQTQTGENTTAIAEVVAYPNPFVIRSSGDLLRFNSSADLPVRIYATSGELVAELTVNQPWDGRNQSGKACASGVYLYILNGEDGTVGRGKFLLVREQ